MIQKPIVSRITIFTGILIFIISIYAFTTRDRYFEIARQMEIFADVYKTINENYIDDVEPGKLMKYALDGMLKELDPYTNYIPESKLQEYRLSTDGEYSGIGATGSWHNKRYLIDEVFEGFTADKAGIQVGDEVTKIDGKTIVGLSNDDITQLVRGQKDSEIKLTLKKVKSNNETDITLKRSDIEMKAVPYSGMVDSNIGYINLTAFTRGCAGEVKSAFAKLKEQNKLEGLVLDLRDNGGGLLNEAIEICNIFIEKDKTVVDVRGRIEKQNESLKTKNSAIDATIPLAILINRNSASASEIVSGVLQDYDRAVIIGERSYGKGLVQNTQGISYRAMVKFTTHKYYLPSGRCIQAVNYYGKYADGTNAEHIPDSLRHNFQTANKRRVLDNGGIDPDITVIQQVDNPNFENVKKQKMIEDFVTSQLANYSKPQSAKDLVFTKTDYPKFADYVKAVYMNAESNSERITKKLEASSKTDKYYDAVKQDLASVLSKLNQDKTEFLQTHTDELLKNIQIEFAKRWFYRKGMIELSLNEDENIHKATEILTNKTKMNNLLEVK